MEADFILELFGIIYLSHSCRTITRFISGQCLDIRSHQIRHFRIPIRHIRRNTCEQSDCYQTKIALLFIMQTIDLHF